MVCLRFWDCSIYLQYTVYIYIERERHLYMCDSTSNFLSFLANFRLCIYTLNLTNISERKKYNYRQNTLQILTIKTSRPVAHPRIRKSRQQWRVAESQQNTPSEKLGESASRASKASRIRKLRRLWAAKVLSTASSTCDRRPNGSVSRGHKAEVAGGPASKKQVTRLHQEDVRRRNLQQGSQPTGVLQGFWKVCVVQGSFVVLQTELHWLHVETLKK